MRNHDPAALKRDLRTDIVLQMMDREGIPLTRANYIDLNWAGQPPVPWTWEHEGELPEIFQRQDLGET